MVFGSKLNVVSLCICRFEGQDFYRSVFKGLRVLTIVLLTKSYSELPFGITSYGN